jgi:hypothetical protein
MVKRFFVQILIISLIVCFFGLNFETKVSIRFWFADKLTINEISLFTALAVSYILGIVTIIPFYIIRGFKNKKSNKNIVDNSNTVIDE